MVVPPSGKTKAIKVSKRVVTAIASGIFLTVLLTGIAFYISTTYGLNANVVKTLEIKTLEQDDRLKFYNTQIDDLRLEVQYLLEQEQSIQSLLDGSKRKKKT